MMNIYAYVLLVLTGSVCLNAEPSPLLEGFFGSLNPLLSSVTNITSGLTQGLIETLRCLLKDLLGIDISKILNPQEAIQALKPYCDVTTGTSNLTESQAKELACLLQKSIYAPSLIKLFFYPNDLFIFLGGTCTSGALDILLKNLNKNTIDMAELLKNYFGSEVVKKLRLQSIAFLALNYTTDEISYLLTKNFTSEDIEKILCLEQANFKLKVNTTTGPAELRILYSAICPNGQASKLLSGKQWLFDLIISCPPTNSIITPTCQSKVTSTVQEYYDDVCNVVKCNNIPMGDTPQPLCRGECVSNTPQ